MTDEDTNDRMERANRIREMREGRRRTPAKDDEEDGADATADGGEAETEEDDAVADETQAADDSTPTIDETVETAPADDESDTDRNPGADDGDEFDGTADEESGVETSGFEFEEPTGDDGEDRDNGETAEADTAANEGVERATTESGVAESVSSSDAAEAVDALSGSGGFAIPDQATTVTEDDDQSMLNAEGTVAAARAAAAGRRATHAGDRTRVLEFELGEERFCLDIEYIEEIVELENMTRVPNSPSYVEGVVDLRGQVTAIINPKDALAVDDEGRGDLIVVFDSEEMDEQGHLGWVVDEVRQVTPVTDEEVNESPDEDDEHINGIINREDEDDFIVWTTPDLALNSS
ncbi:hypothetical protein BV210_02905 [Halorientalis sp. IM1011]|uniref:chemotaxis protein CheW n=1 Tax=Halorientalis sp. IM1011 TaxID=1932360 RepID=UPI00097CCED5|nr:chemotaxis protein CheW [Halorientalis sp. IM1011]AQL41729.1 hypothetical protein BV210_02905 [Halorientalis sp. IM1011]